MSLIVDILGLTILKRYGNIFYTINVCLHYCLSGYILIKKFTRQFISLLWV